MKEVSPEDPKVLGVTTHNWVAMSTWRSTVIGEVSGLPECGPVLYISDTELEDTSLPQCGPVLYISGTEL